jgi:hypothetical protein
MTQRDQPPSPTDSSLESRPTQPGSDKRERERALFGAVYEDASFAEVTHGDAPDFVLRRHPAEAAFGVEVTEVFETGTDARVRFHPTYVSHLLTGGRHMHRDDVDVLQLTAVTIHDADGKLKAEHVPAIVRKAATSEQRYGAIAKSVTRKTLQAANYRGDLSHINLIIGDCFDTSNDGVAADGEYAVPDLLVPALRAALLQSPFREVFLVGETLDGQRRYRPLQQLLLLEAFFLFCAACRSFPGALEGGADFQFSDVIPLFVQIQRGSGMRLWTASVGGSLVAMYRGAGARLEGGSVGIVDFGDHPSPAPAAVPPPRFDPEVVAALEGYSATFTAKNRFRTVLAMDARRVDERTGAPEAPDAG